MTLYRQMLLFTSALFCILFVCAWVIKLQSTRTFLQDQLESHAQDTATSLGLSIQPHIAENDLATVDTMINAVFDRGYYQKILLTDLAGKTLVERSQEVHIREVPPWFIEAIPLATPDASTLITSGWQQVGSLYVQSHPGYAYKTLWQTTVNMTKVFAAVAGLALLAGALSLRYLLRPLRQVELQAEDLCKRQYRFQTKLPRTRELRRVVVAMNSMTGKIKQMFDEQAQVADRLRKNAYSDPLTGLGNRRYLEGQVAAGMDRTETAVQGGFLLVQVDSLLELNQTKGYEYTDLLLQKIGDAIRKAAKASQNAALARISGGSFAIFLPEATDEETGRVAEKIARGLSRLSTEEDNLPQNIGQVGGVSYDQVTDLGRLLSAADRLAGAARSSGPNSWKTAPLSSEPAGAPLGEQQWIAILDRVLAEKDMAVFCQQVVAADNLQKHMHLELFARITMESGEMLSAGIFIPLAERLQRVSAIDRMVIEKALHLTGATLLADEVAVNVSTSSLQDEVFVAWVYAKLKKQPQDAPKIVFEFSEYHATQELKLLEDFSREIQSLGHFIGLDHFGQSFANFGYLKSLQPRYVKIDRAFTDELRTADSNSHFFIGSLAGVAHSLDILVIAEGVEEDIQYQALRSLNIDGVQGYFIGRPELMPGQ